MLKLLIIHLAWRNPSFLHSLPDLSNSSAKFLAFAALQQSELGPDHLPVYLESKVSKVKLQQLTRT